MYPGFSPAPSLVLVAPVYNGKEAQTENKSQSISKPYIKNPCEEYRS
jgi:hypothetical protein